MADQTRAESESPTKSETPVHSENDKQDRPSSEASPAGPSGISVAQVGAVLVTVAAIAGGLATVNSKVTRLMILISGVVLAWGLLAIRKLRPRLIVAACSILTVLLAVTLSGTTNVPPKTRISTGRASKSAASAGASARQRGSVRGFPMPSSAASGSSGMPTSSLDGVVFNQIINEPLVFAVRPAFIHLATSVKPDSAINKLCNSWQQWIAPSLADSRAVIAHLEWLVVTFHVVRDVVLEMGYLDAAITKRIPVISWPRISCAAGGGNDITVSVNLTTNPPIVKFDGHRYLQVTFKKGDVGSIGFYVFLKHGMKWKATWHYFVDNHPGQLKLITYPVAAIPSDRALPDVWVP